jgi:hypothetical protein
MKEFDKTLTVLEENIQKKSHENEEDRGRHRRGKPESKVCRQRIKLGPN